MTLQILRIKSKTHRLTIGHFKWGPDTNMTSPVTFGRLCKLHSPNDNGDTQNVHTSMSTTCRLVYKWNTFFLTGKMTPALKMAQKRSTEHLLKNHEESIFFFEILNQLRQRKTIMNIALYFYKNQDCINATNFSNGTCKIFGWPCEIWYISISLKTLPLECPMHFSMIFTANSLNGEKRDDWIFDHFR